MKIFPIIVLVTILITLVVASGKNGKGRKKGHDLRAMTSNPNSPVKVRHHSKKGSPTHGKMTHEVTRRRTKSKSKRSLTGALQTETIDPTASDLDIDRSLLDSSDWFLSGPGGFEDLQSEGTFWPFTGGSYYYRPRPAVVVKRRKWWPAGPAA